jgi:subtilisin family serine protease
MKTFVLFLIMSIKAQAASPVIVAVIDTGYSIQDESLPFCKFGHATFAGNDVKDRLGHGTNIAHIINAQVKSLPKGSWCMVVIKFFDKDTSSDEALSNSVKALRWIKKLNVDIVNLSYEGGFSSNAEKAAVKALLDKGIKVVAAAGNRNTKPGFPASADKRVIVVGNLQKDGSRHPTSNFGDSVNRWEVGTDVCAGGSCMTGTSQATAIVTGKILKKMIERKSK